MSSDFPADSSVNAFYAAAEQRKRTGEVEEVRLLKLDGIKGESADVKHKDEIDLTQ